jgi:hypothetical protein
MSDGDSAELVEELSLDGELHRIEDPVRVGRYRLCYELGSGGMATVYLARVEGPGGFARPVAIKRIHPHLARRRDLVAMFLDEARIISAIHHPNVCATFDFGEADGSYYLAMEYLVGESLALLQRRVARDPALLASARWHRVFAKIIADAGEGLHAAHELKDERGRPLQVIHRDVSPQNVFVTYDGVAKVVDFGVAFASDRITRTVTGGIKGKIGYFAPEQIARQPCDRRVDVWALGIVLWEGLTGRRLFTSRSEVDTLLAVQHKEIRPPSALVPSIAPELDTITLRALRRDPEVRYPSARAMSRDLVAYLGTTGALIDNVEVGELVQQVCADRRDVRGEVVASVMEDRPRTLSTARSPAVATVLQRPLAEHAHEATEVREVLPSVPPPADAPEPAPGPAPAPGPGPTTERASPGGEAGLVGLVRLALVLLAAVAVVSLGVLALRQAPTSGTLPTLAPAEGPPAEPRSLPLGAAPSDAGARRDPGSPEMARDAAAADGGVAARGDAGRPDAGRPDAGRPDAGRPDAGRRRDSLPEAPARAYGDLVVTSPVAVEVCHRGACRWTPAVLPRLPAGRVVLTLRARDGTRWTRAVNVEAGATVRILVEPP